MADALAMRERAARTGASAARAAVENESVLEEAEGAPFRVDADAAPADVCKAPFAAAEDALFPTPSAESEATSATNSSERSAMRGDGDDEACVPIVQCEI